MKITDIKINPDNPRFITDDDFQKLIDSIKRDPKFMKLKPITIDENNIITAGNMRYRALVHLGYKEIPDEWVQSAADLTEEERRRFIVIDNVEFGDFDWDMMAAEYSQEELEEWGVDMMFDSGDDTKDGLTDPDEVPEIEKNLFKVQPGDKFQLGNHILMCGDSTNENDVGVLMGGKEADMVFTDPPYNIDYGNNKSRKHKVREIENDNMNETEYHAFCNGFIANIKKYCVGCVYIAGAPGPDGRILFSIADNTLHCSTVIIWNKDSFTLGRGKYQNQYEPIWFGWNGDGKKFTSERNISNVWDVARPKRSDEHPTMKPVELVLTAVKHASGNGDIVLDLFAGSGTSFIACEQSERSCRGMEIDPHYCSVIIKRWEEFTGLKSRKMKK